MPPLALPARDDLDDVADSPAVKLFVERARALRPDFALSGANAAALAEICPRLDGLPLAIELAAARVPLLPAAGAPRPARRAPDAPDRRRARPARAAADAARGDRLELQAPARTDEQTLLARLAVFAGGWTLEAAEVVCVHDGDVIDELGSRWSTRASSS